MKASGYNHYNSPLVQTNCTKESMPLVCPPLDLSLDPSTLISFSSYGEHAVWVTKDYKAYAIGSNMGSRISTYLANEVFTEPVEVILPDSKGFPMQILSAACGFFYTLYMCCTIQEDGNQGTSILILFWASENKKYYNQPFIVDIGNHKPIGIFAGSGRAAVIDEEGFIYSPTPHHSNEYDRDPPYKFVRLKLPFNEKAISVACCNNFLVALSNRGKVFANGAMNYQSKAGIKETHFARIDEFRGIRIIHISGTYEHCIAVSIDGRVFVVGANNVNQLGLGNVINRLKNNPPQNSHYRYDWFDNFTQLISVHFSETSKIVAAYAGRDFSFFVAEDGKLYACGSNYYRQLFSDNNPNTKESYDIPIETTITNGTTFVIAGNHFAVALVGCEPLKYMPNLPVGKVIEETVESLEVTISILQAQLAERDHLIHILKQQKDSDQNC